MRALARLEAAVATFERGLIVVLLAVMTLSVFLDALHRLFAAEEGRTTRLLLWLLPDALAGAIRAWLAPALLMLATLAIVAAALRARVQDQDQGDDGAHPRRRWLLAAAITLALAAATQLLVALLPHGLVFSQQMSLCFMLWIALAGASLGARERAHIAFELAGKLWPPRLRRPTERLARTLAAAFSLFLAVLAAAHTREHFAEWTSSDGSAGLFEAFRVPRFLVYGFLPFPFAVMGLRFLAFGVRADDASAEATP
jgi:TRAP-type C4-dicarboxylate transport system permease small subunit